MSWSAELGFGAARGLRRLRRRPVAALWAVGAIALALYLYGLARLAHHNLDHLRSTWGGVDLVVYLDDGVGERRAHAIAAALDQLPAVERVDYVPPERALERLRGSLGRHHALVDGLEPAALPASLEVRLAPGIAEVASAHPVIARLAATPGVEDLDFAGDWVERASGLLAGLERGCRWLLLLFGGACVYFVACAVRLSSATAAGEVRLGRLLGAGTTFVAAPRLVSGFVAGASGGALALLLLWLSFAAFGGDLASLLGDAFGPVEIGFLPVAEAVLVVALGAGLGLLGGALAGQRERHA